MTLEDAVFQYLAAQPGVIALVPRARIYRYVIPQNSAYPALVIQRVDTIRVLVQEGASGVAESRLQVSAFSALNDAESRQIADEVRLAVDGYRGSWGTVRILRSYIDTEVGLYDDLSQTYQTVVDVLATFHEQPEVH